MSLDVYLSQVQPTDVYSANITHNLGNMAEKVGLYEALWRPEEIGVNKANQLIPLLSEGLKKLKADPEGCKKLNPSNGWGTYEGLVKFVEKYLEACILYPESDVIVSR